MANESGMYKLFFVDKELPGKPKSVTISKSADIDDLRKQIQADSYYKGVDPSELVLYRVDIPDTHNLSQDVEEKSKAPGESLRPTSRIGKCYPLGPPEDTVHILVVRPESPNSTG